ncbi:uncharacterized protein C6orf136 homolog isoform X2 [Alligator sinensis]|uniref:Uncharacterized protein C6orf136 homolog isoform X2 n=1 Tax=Alligator sinensis TaxID=38654 RepID=A0A3Q0HLI6_ALLSI|nr:uncharacterized protein C6orf136 homolog isoform X2 [Alligator sinensis]
MYQRSRAVAVAGRLRPTAGVRGWAWGVGGPRWGQAEALGCCGQARHQDPAPCGGAACRALGSPRSTAVKCHSSLAGHCVEAAGFPFLLAPEREEAAARALEQKRSRSRSLLPPRLKQRRCLWPATACLLEGLEGPVTMVDGRREDDIAVRDNEGLDGPSLDFLRSLFDSRPCRIPYQAFEACVLLVPFQAAPGPAPGAATSGSPKSSDPSMEEHLAIMYEKLHHELPNFFLKKQNYQIYSEDVEFINEILHGTNGLSAVADSVPLCGLELLCQPADGGAEADSAPRELEYPGPMAYHGATLPYFHAALLQEGQEGAVQDLRCLFHFLLEFPRSDPLSQDR